MEMEDKNNSLHSSLPSNYVTLAQLQQRWLQQKQQQQEQNQQQQQKQQQQRRNGFRWKNRNDRYRTKIRTDSGTDAENQRELEGDAEIGDGKSDREITTIESTKNDEKKYKNKRVKQKRKPRVDKRGMKEEAKTEEKKEQEGEDSEKGGSVISSELHEEKKIDGSVVEEIEQKIGDFSISAVNNGNGRGRGGYFRHSQSRRGSYGGRGYGGYGGYRNGYGDRNFDRGFWGQRNEVKEKRGEKMVWVRKSENVNAGSGGIET